MDLRASLDAIVDRLETARDDLVADLDPAEGDRIALFRTITIDPTKLDLPGILVQLSAVDLDTLQGHTVAARLLVVAPQRDDPRSLDTLNDGVRILEHADIEFAGTLTTTGVRVPKHPKPMPGLAVPVQIHETE